MKEKNQPPLPGVNTLLRKAVKIDSKGKGQRFSTVFERGVRAWCSSVCSSAKTMPQKKSLERQGSNTNAIMTKTRTSTLEHRYHSAAHPFAMGIFVKLIFLHVVRCSSSSAHFND